MKNPIQENKRRLQTGTVVVYFSATWQNSLSMISYARAIVKKLFRTE